MVKTLKTVGLFGGTFDPVHHGHLRMALELKMHLQLDEMRLLPAHIPPHRPQPSASNQDRLAMLQLATGDCADLQIDTVEFDNPAISYSINTLRHFRKTSLADASICFAMGMDSLGGLQTWYQWQSLLDVAHIIVAARPGWSLPAEGEMFNYIEMHRGQVEDLHRLKHGKIVVSELSLLPISSTEIREQIAKGQSPQYLLPNAVYNYILQRKLYQ